MKKRFTEEQIIGFLREAESGLPVAELCRRHGFSEASYYLWRSKFGGMSVSDAKRLKELEAENGRHRADTFNEAHGIGLGIPEGNPGTGNQIEPVLQLGRYVQVIHGSPYQQHIARLEFGNQFVGQGDHAFRALAQVLGSPQRVEHFMDENRQGEGGKITHDYLIIEPSGLALGQEGID